MKQVYKRGNHYIVFDCERMVVDLEGSDWQWIAHMMRKDPDIYVLDESVKAD